MSFGSDPGRDDGGLPPVNVVIPDDARELEPDVLAYRRELRARRRQARLSRITRPLRGHAALLPLIASCLMISMMAGMMFSLVTITPASAPTLPPGRFAFFPYPLSCSPAANALAGAASPGTVPPPCLGPAASPARNPARGPGNTP